jgi:hypothetical protein
MQVWVPPSIPAKLALAAIAAAKAIAATKTRFFISASLKMRTAR